MRNSSKWSLRAALGVWLLASAALADQRPNFIFVLVDDVGWNDLAYSGDPVVETPNIDRLAREGLIFDAAYLTTSSCSPSRCSIITGRYPHNTGASELHTPLPKDQPMFPQLLRSAGYYTVLSGKNHMGSAVQAAFERISSGEGPGREGDWVRILAERPRDRPFFCWFASTDAHRDWQFSDHAARCDPAQVRVPPFLYDGPDTRQDLANYLHEVGRIDHFIGALREELERQEIARETFVIFCSDNGRPFPRCKTRLYDSGIRTPFIIWRPGVIASERSASLVSAIDIAPTVLELAGVAPDPRMQGVSLRPLFENPDETVRDYVFAEHNWHVYQAHERMVRAGDHVYIRNSWPERQNLCVESADVFPAGIELWKAEAEGRLAEHQRDIFQVPRAGEELYDLVSDPHQLHNLARDEASLATLTTLRGALDRWVVETGDSVPTHPTPDRGAGNRRGDDERRGEHSGAEHGAGAIVAPGPIRKNAVHMATGIKIGEVTARTAIVWTRLTAHSERNADGLPFEDLASSDAALPKGKGLHEMEGAVPGAAGEVRLSHWPAGHPKRVLSTAWSAVDADADHTRAFVLQELEPGVEYRLLIEGRGPGAETAACRIEGAFGTAPLLDSFSPMSFCVVTGQGYHRRDETALGHRIYGHMGSLDPDFLVHTGDTVYYDKPRPWAKTAALARFKWNRIYGLPLQREFHRSVPAYFLRDDHDTLRDDCWPGQSYGEIEWEDGLRLFREQVPVGQRPYRTVRWGRDVQLWFMEGREFRSPNNTPDGPRKTIWGDAQKRWLFETLGASDATFRVIVSPTPIVGPDRSSKNDNHANKGFAHEGREVRHFLADLGNVIVICGDRHWQYVSSDPETGLMEFSSGPTSDAHAGGFKASNRSEMHTYLKIVGGFLLVELRGEPGAPELVLQHHGTRGEVLHEEVVLPNR